MTWRDDSTAINVSLLSTWADSVLRPLVRILRSAGVSLKVILHTTSRAYAEYSLEAPRGHLGAGSRYATILALGSITGAWARSPAWTDEGGLPRELALNPNDPRGFHALVKSVEPHFDGTCALRELERLNVVRLIDSSTRIRLLRHTIVHLNEDTFYVEAVLADLRRFAETIEHNLFRNQQTAEARTQVTAIRLSMDGAHFPEFERFAKRLGQAFLDSADDFLTSYPDSRNGVTFGTGFFVHFDDSHRRASYDDTSTATNVSRVAQWAYDVLRPVVRILRSAGVSLRSIQECIEETYRLYDHEAPQGRLGAGSGERTVHALALIPDAWAHSPEWTDFSGLPRDLSLAKHDPSGFFALTRSVAPHLDPGTALLELQRMKVVLPIGALGSVRLLRATVIHIGSNTFSVEPVFYEFQRFVETIEHNLFRDRRTAAGRFQTTAACLSLDAGQFAHFARFVKRNGQMLLQSVDDRLKTYAEATHGATFGAGLFAFYDAA
jgi:hypothetical protein